MCYVREIYNVKRLVDDKIFLWLILYGCIFKIKLVLIFKEV